MMKKNSLQEGSQNYYSKVNVYDRFSQAEDYKKKVINFLIPKIKGKIVLDLGCGSGRYASLLAHLTKKYYCLDISEQQIKLAKKNTKNIKNIKFICSSAENIRLNKKVDVVISSWVISTVQSFRKRANILNQALKVLQTKGEIYLIENDFKGEFENIRMHPKRTKKFIKWLGKKGFKQLKKINTYFKFKSVEEAKNIFNLIWGRRVSNKIKTNIINHKILIFKNILKTN